jgi:RHS repeat-associated protein
MDDSAASGCWQLLEERIDDDNDAAPGTNRHVQYLWGPRYIDDILCRRQDSDLDGEYLDSPGGDYWYHCTDVQFSTVAILDDLATLLERVEYDPYGVARHHRRADLDGDGDTDSADYDNVLAPNWGNFGPGDLNRDGTVNVTDLLIWNADYGAALPLGELSHPGVDNQVGYAGYIHTGGGFLWLARNRHHEPRLGRWVERDPAGYVDGMGLYAFVGSAPTSGADPM